MAECAGYRCDRQFTKCSCLGVKPGIPPFFLSALYHINNLFSRRIVPAGAAANLFTDYTKKDIPYPFHFHYFLPERHRSALCRICRQCAGNRCFQQNFRRNNIIGQPYFNDLFCPQLPPGQHHIQSRRQTDQRRKTLCPAGTGQQPQLNFRQAEPGFITVGDNTTVAGHSQFQPASETTAVNSGNNRQRIIFDQIK